ncbi:hypothetical protein E2562_032949 [Oryza meyeriana var. granulata]|uniref:Uncharacterized protein n=1 Tax=Oryza meyeriana var. granulata TaxID=110450 RepID=A0A6G1DR77_9ORYZ|nr:hypothetical protein E2562_032949 [Oryza meyeriana var. granulata]
MDLHATQQHGGRQLCRAMAWWHVARHRHEVARQKVATTAHNGVARWTAASTADGVRCGDGNFVAYGRELRDGFTAKEDCAIGG